MSNINPVFANMSESKTQQQSLSLTTGGKSLEEAHMMKSTQNLAASHGAEELSDEQLETVSGGWYRRYKSNPLHKFGYYTLF
ncbi:bacteriocin [Coleofasciculus sp. E1-EBD-02]|jgi:bacteriocin-like protein|uniref:bacteriocin n=1 Tax=Coleofasciculus sp. E1-EBD-02 TaxID=3068481 RepID=UPI0033034BA4